MSEEPCIPLSLALRLSGHLSHAEIKQLNRYEDQWRELLAEKDKQIDTLKQTIRILANNGTE